MDDWAQKIIRDIPPELKLALIREAEQQGTNMNDVAVAVLAAAFDVPFEPSGNRTPGLSDSTTVGLKMPRRLRRKLNVTAARLDTTATDLVLDVLLAHFDLRVAAA